MIGAIIGIAQVLKTLGLNPKLIPLANLFLGILLCVFLSDMEIRLWVFNGLIIGLSASGLFSTQKNVLQSVHNSKQ